MTLLTAAATEPRASSPEESARVHAEARAATARLYAAVAALRPASREWQAERDAACTT